MTNRGTANRLRQYRESARLQQEELEKALEKHGYKFSRGYISLVECARTAPSFEFLRGCELVYGLDWGELIREWIFHIAETKGEPKHMTVWQFHKLLGESLQRLTPAQPPLALEEETVESGEDAVEE